MGEQLTCYEFGAELLRTNDLDPVYVLLHGAGLTPLRLKQWLLSYWCFYHVGTASWVTDQSEEGGVGYWKAMQMAAESSNFPRSSERRHYRGAQALESVGWLHEQGLSRLFDPLTVGRVTAPELITYARTWVGFGSWSAFKVADMVERLGLAEVSFTGGELLLFDSPRKGAEKLAEAEGYSGSNEGLLRWAVGRVVSELKEFDAPPRYERKVNIQEGETVLCKWHSYIKGHYHVGEDIAAVRKGLGVFDCPTAKRLYANGRKAGLWDA